MRDGIGQYFPGRTVGRRIPSEAALYYTEADAVAAENRYEDGEHSPRHVHFETRDVTDRDAWTVEELVKHLTHFGGFHVEKNHEPRGVVIEVHWDDLRKTE